jgi:DNA-binding response OmpR family regulator
LVAPAKRILSVSYELALLMRREFLLKSAGYAVISALGHAEALYICRRGGFDLMIIGHAMPRGDKLSLTRFSHEICSAPVLVLTRHGEEPFQEADAVVEAAEDDAVILDIIRRLL